MYFLYTCVYIHMYTEMWTEIKKITKRLTIGEFDDGYVHCIVFLPLLEIIISNLKVWENNSQNMKYFKGRHI